jgi:hypothetical protein
VGVWVCVGVGVGVGVQAAVLQSTNFWVCGCVGVGGCLGGCGCTGSSAAIDRLARVDRLQLERLQLRCTTGVRDMCVLILPYMCPRTTTYVSSSSI